VNVIYFKFIHCVTGVSSATVLLLVVAVVLFAVYWRKQHKVIYPEHQRRSEWEKGYRQIMANGMCDV